MKRIVRSGLRLGILASTLASGLALADIDAQIQVLSAGGAGPFSATDGESFWQQNFSTANGEQRSCAACHGKDPTLSGKHLTTGKDIEPMAISTNPLRFTDSARSDKWFRRNCRWTLGRECTAQEKGDVMTWLKQN